MPFANYKDFADCVAKNSDKKDANAYCATIMRATEDMHADFQRILSSFISHFKDGTGLTRFQQFIANNSFDVSQPYLPSFQRYRESFQWIEPLIEFYKQDTEAKYYKVRALTANVSMNNHDYSDEDKLAEATPTMRYRRINLNHDHEKRFTFPRTRTEVVNTEDMALELLMRVDNEDKYFQMQLDHDPGVPKEKWINYPSVEVCQDRGKNLLFRELACLEIGTSIPGDPLTEIVPLLLNEGMRDSIVGNACKIVGGEIVCDAMQPLVETWTQNGVFGESVTVIKGGEKITTLNEQETGKEDFMAKCMADGKSKDDCEASWAAKNADEKILGGNKNTLQDANVKIDEVLRETLVKLEKEGASKDRKIAEQGLLIKEYNDRVHLIETENLEFRSKAKSMDATIGSMKADVAENENKHQKERAEDKRLNGERVQRLEDGFTQTRERLERELQEHRDARSKLETLNLDRQKEILDLQHERNQVAEQKKKAVDDMLEAQNELAKTSEKFADLQSATTSLSKQVNIANNKVAQESKEKQDYIEKLTQLEQVHNKTKNLTKQILRKMAESQLIFQTDDGQMLTDKDV